MYCVGCVEVLHIQHTKPTGKIIHLSLALNPKSALAVLCFLPLSFSEPRVNSKHPAKNHQETALLPPQILVRCALACSPR